MIPKIGRRRQHLRLTPKRPWYFITTLLVFWLPLVPLAGLTWKRLAPEVRKSFWCGCAAVGLMTFGMEFVYRRTTKIWTFSESVDRLLGPRILGEPVEEFSFWNGATPFILLVYLTFHRLGRKEVRANE